MNLKNIATFALCAIIAGVASAGQVVWSLAEGAFEGQDPGSVAYLIDDSAYPVADATKDVLAGEFPKASTVASVDLDEYGEVYTTPSQIFSAGDVTLYTLVVNPTGDKFIVSESVTHTFGTAGNQTYNFSGSFASSSWTAIPEPTTVALLALGLAAIGLKRKVA